MRREDWVERLDAVFRAAQSEPFAWGSFDCCLFAADCVQAVLGKDVAAEFRGRYATRGQAFRLIRSKWGSIPGLAESMAAAHGWTGTPLLAAQRGDVALVMADDGRQAIAVVDLSGRMLAFPATRGGLATVSLTAGLRAWRIA